jgi:hypothetical protein
LEVLEPVADNLDCVPVVDRELSMIETSDAGIAVDSLAI